MKKIITSLFLAISPFCFSQQYSQKYSDVNYAGDGNAFHALDIYLPKATKAKYPVVVYVYGSAWMSNNGKGGDMNTIGAALLDAGFAVVTPNHRSSSDAIFPAQINDIKAVVRFLRGNSSTYKLDTSFIGISGSSSGGHLAALMGTSNYVKQYTVKTASANIEGSVGNFTSYISAVDAVCDWFGPTDFLKMDSCGSQLNHNAANSPESSLIGGAIQNNKDKVALANPITYVDPTDPPFLIIHGNQDALVPYCESVFLYNALQKKGVSSQYIQVSGGQHGGNVTQSTANINTMVQFFLAQASKVVTSIESNYAATNEAGFYSYVSGNEIILHVSNPENFEHFQLMDISGKKVAEGSIYGTELSLPSIKNGMYVFKIYKRNGDISSLKVVVNE